MKKIAKIFAVAVIGGSALLATLPAQAFWGPFDWFDDDDGWYGPWGGPYGYAPYGYGPYGYTPYGYGPYGYPAYGYPGYGAPTYGYPGYGAPAYGYPGYGFGYPYTAPAPAAPSSSKPPKPSKKE